MKAFAERYAPWLLLSACLLVTLAVIHWPETSPIAPASAFTRGQSARFCGEELPLRPYLPDEPVWHASLGLWKAHEGLDIQCISAHSLTDGTVASVQTDPLWGTSVAIETGEERVIYRSLGTCAVRTGQSVQAGDVLGTAGAAPCEAELGAHIHIEYYRGGIAADPCSLLPGSPTA